MFYLSIFHFLSSFSSLKTDKWTNNLSPGCFQTPLEKNVFLLYEDELTFKLNSQWWKAADEQLWKWIQDKWVAEHFVHISYCSRSHPPFLSDLFAAPLRSVEERLYGDRFYGKKLAYGPVSSSVCQQVFVQLRAVSAKKVF